MKGEEYNVENAYFMDTPKQPTKCTYIICAYKKVLGPKNIKVHGPIGPIPMLPP